MQDATAINGSADSSILQQGSAPHPSDLPPPPAYQSTPHASEIHDTKEKTPPPADITNSTPSSRTFLLKADSWAWRHFTIFDTTTCASRALDVPVYTARCRLLSPQLILTSSDASTTTANTVVSSSTTKDTTEPCATAVFHSWSGNIDITLRGAPVRLTSKGMFKDGFTYPSPTLQGQQMTWRTDKHSAGFKLVLTDETGTVVARVAMGFWSLTKVGTMEILDGRFLGGKGDGAVANGKDKGVDEVIATGFSVLRVRLMNMAVVVGST